MAHEPFAISARATSATFNRDAILRAMQAQVPTIADVMIVGEVTLPDESVAYCLLVLLVNYGVAAVNPQVLSEELLREYERAGSGLPRQE